MVHVGTNLPPGVGIDLPTRKGICMNRTGSTLAVGEVVMSDIKATDAGFGGNASAAAYLLVTNPGSEGFPMNNMITPTTAGIGVLTGGTGDPGYPIGVVSRLLPEVGQTAGGDDTKIEVTFQGYCQVKMAATAASGTEGLPIMPANAVRTASVTVAAAVRPFGRILVDVTTANATSFCYVDGISGRFEGSLFAS